MGDLMYRKKAILLNEPHPVPASGNPMTFDNAEYARFKRLEINFRPDCAGTGTPSPSNVRTMSGLTGISMSWCGKNLFDMDSAPFAVGQYISSVSDGKIITTSNSNYSVFAVPVNGDTQYSVGKIKANDPMYAFVDAYGVVIDSGKNSGGTAGTTKTLTSPAGSAALLLSVAVNGTYKCDNVLQVESGPATAYEAYRASTVPVSWQSEAGTVYAGEIDLVNGILTKTHEYAIYTGSSSEDWSVQTIGGGKNYYISCPQAAETEEFGYLFCNMAKTKTSTTGNLAQGEVYVSAYKNLNVCLGTASGTSTVAEWRTWLAAHNLQIVYKLINPVVYTIPTQSLRTLRGWNNIVTDIGCNLSAAVWTR